MTDSPMPGRECPCGSAQTYTLCCGRWHAGEPAPDALALMRSRYCAYVLGHEDYLLATWHPHTRPATLDLAQAGPTAWLGLEIKRHILDAADRSTVEFVARYRVAGGSAVRMHEISRFLHEHGRWFYLDGEFPAQRRAGRKSP